MTDPQRLPLFPLNNVLFPQGSLNLRVFEARYLDMIGACMKANSSFGVCLIQEGEEVGTPAVPHRFGTEARIVDWDMSEPGILGLSVRGGRRFRLLEELVSSDGLITGIVQWVEEPPPEPVSAEHELILPLLRMILADAGKTRIPLPHALNDAAWVGYRYAELLPIPALARQRLLELEDSDLRLAIIEEFLQQRGLLNSSDKDDQNP